MLSSTPIGVRMPLERKHPLHSQNSNSLMLHTLLVLTVKHTYIVLNEHGVLWSASQKLRCADQFRKRQQAAPAAVSVERMSRRLRQF